MECLGKFKDFTDNSIKSVFNDNDKIVEMTLLQNRKDTDVICAPTHHFCNLGCRMCHLTNNKLNKSMVPINYNNFEKALCAAVTNFSGQRITNKKILLISFMGVGEPLLNIDLLKEVFMHRDELCKKLNYDHIGFALSTMMPNDKNIDIIKDFVNQNDIPLKIHFSLHTPFDDKRKHLIPGTNVNIETVMNRLKNYEKTMSHNSKISEEWLYYHRSKDFVEIHYTLIEGNNDSNEELKELTKIINKYGFTVKFIRFNPIHDLKRSPKEEKWVQALKEINCGRVKIYSPPGREIGSSCGEFTKHYYHKEIETKEELEEFLKWKKEHQIFN